MTDYLVIIVNFGNISTKNICKSLDRIRVNYFVIEPEDILNITNNEITHIILSGGEKHVYDSDSYILHDWIIHNNIPVLCICYGMQLLAYSFGCNVIRMKEKEEEPVKVIEIINNVETIKFRWMNRFDRVMNIPENFTLTGITNKNHIAAFTDNIKWWAIQYHPEAEECNDINVFIDFLLK